MLALVAAGGTLGYMLIEGWSAWDAFYMTIITISTVGYKEVHDLSRAGQVLTVALVIGGVGATLYTLTLLVALVVEGGVGKRLHFRQRTRMLEGISDHFILCGYGRIGSIIAGQLRRQDIPHVVIERDSARVQAALEDGSLAVEADASREDVLRRTGIERARGLIAAVGTDAENVYAVLSARVLRPDLFIVGRAETEDARIKLTRAGANRVVSPYQIGAVQLAQTALRPAVVDFMELATSAENLELAIEGIAVTPNSPLVGQSMVSANLRQRFGVIVVGIQHQNRQMEFDPQSSVTIAPGDTLVVLGRPTSLKRLEREAAV